MFSEQFVGILNYLFLLGSSWPKYPDQTPSTSQWVDINDVVTFKMVCSMISPSEQCEWVKCEILELAGGFKLILMEDHLSSNITMAGDIITIEAMFNDQDKRR